MSGNMPADRREPTISWDHDEFERTLEFFELFAYEDDIGGRDYMPMFFIGSDEKLADLPLDLNAQSIVGVILEAYKQGHKRGAVAGANALRYQINKLLKED